MSEKSITLTAELTDAEALVIALAEIQSGTEDHDESREQREY
jgi:hypothetical protein